MKPITLGTCFSIPLKEGYGFGYVNYEGNFLSANIWDYRSRTNNKEDFIKAFDSPLLIIDWNISWGVFSRSKHMRKRTQAWKLHRNIMYDTYSSPLEPYIILASSSDPIKYNYLTKKEEEFTSVEDIKKHPHAVIDVADYYTFYVQAKYDRENFKDVLYNREKDCYELVDRLRHPRHR